MAKFRNINHTAFERAHFLRIERYARAVEQVYVEAIKEFAQLAGTVNFDPNRPFTFSTYRNTHKVANQLFAEMANMVTATVLRGDKEEWLAAASNNDRLVEAISSTSRVQRHLMERYSDRNLDALKAFQNRKIGGMGLSDRIWLQTQQFKDEIELGIDLGLGEGRSAAQLSRDLRSYLKEPDKLFRRVRDKHGALHLSRSAKSFNPGQGVYRSSYKNAMRLTRTETNMAYRESDYHRWQEMDFIVGFEVRLSNNPNHCPMCAQLAGRYPKEFKFTGWHPQCRCRAIPIFKTDEEVDGDIARILEGDNALQSDESANVVTAMPDGYMRWMQDNGDRIRGAKSTPYFIRDNYKGGDVRKGLRFAVKETKAPVHVPETALKRYEKELGINVKRSIFSHLSEPVPMKSIGNDGAYYHPQLKYVNIPIDDIRRRSKWKAESVVYHEYGHAIDWQHGLRKRPEVKSLMDKYREKYAKDNNKLFKEFDEKLWDMGVKATIEKKYERASQVAALDDTIMALNSDYGRGHSKMYFAQEGFPEAEFLAHAFENKYKGNPIFKKLAPDLYMDMVDLLDKILPKR